MRTIVQDADTLAHMTWSGTKTRWSELYESEEALLLDLLDIDTKALSFRYFKGQEYVKGFQRYHEEHGELTDRQMRQLKRIAKEVAKWHMENHMKRSGK